MSTVEEKEAKHGEKMIEVKIRFWTDGMAESKGKVKPKHAWTSGVARMQRNKSHGIKSEEKPIPFNSLMEIGIAVEKCLIKHGITLHIAGNRMGKYIKE